VRFHRFALFDEIFGSAQSAQAPTIATPVNLSDADPVTIIYTSGTSGEPKGVVLNYGNITYMLGCTGARLDLLMAGYTGIESVFHYLPLCFAGSWISLLSYLFAAEFGDAFDRSEQVAVGDGKLRRRTIS